MDEIAARRLTYETENVVVENELLLFLRTTRKRKFDRAYAVVKMLCIPHTFCEQIAIGSHDFNLHLGFHRLFATAKLRYYFKNMYSFSVMGTN